ncbi:MAG: hypothetical protein LBI34_00535, partial [Puniceicoccales bacterium]|nr:hypothetical protein [Puniceicoccales bacterium]
DEFHETCDIDDRTVADFLIRTGATKPFIEWARKTNFQDASVNSCHTGEYRAIYRAIAEKNVIRVLQFVSEMPANSAVEILNCKCKSGNPNRVAHFPSFATSVVRYCINQEVVKLLRTTVQKLPEEQRNKVVIESD